jgi:outer membrane protein, heavy metal efflux system
MLILTFILALQAELPPANLAALLKEAEQNNPDIAAALSRRAEAETKPSQLEAFPDPVAGASYTNAGLTRSTLGEDGDTMLWLSWSQEVPYPGKRRLARVSTSPPV